MNKKLAIVLFCMAVLCVSPVIVGYDLSSLGRVWGFTLIGGVLLANMNPAEKAPTDYLPIPRRRNVGTVAG